MEARSPKLSCQQGRALSEGSRDPSLPLPGRGRCSSPGYPLAYCCTSPVSAPGFTWSSLRVSFLAKDTRQIGSEPTHMTSFCLIYLIKGTVSKYSHILRSWGLGLQQRNLGKDTVQHMTIALPCQGGEGSGSRPPLRCGRP